MAAEGARPTLLVVDDEERILSALVRSLRREGYDIVTAGSPEAALEVLEARTVDAILSDQKMPGMSGLNLLARASVLCPEATRMLITGWTEEIPPEQIEEIGIHALINKPWDDGELKRILREALGLDSASRQPGRR